MRFDKFTIKSQELIQNSQGLASQYNHQQFEPEHLLAAMLKEPEGIAGAMLRKLGVSPDEIAQRVVAALEKLPRVSGGGISDIYVSPRAKAVLEAAFAQATRMKDEYVSIEHIFLAIADEKHGEAAEILHRCRRHTGFDTEGTDGNSRHPAHYRSESGRKIPGPGKIQPGSDGSGTPGQGRSCDRKG